MERSSHNIDHILLLTTLALLAFGLIMIASIGVPRSIKLSAPDILYPNCGMEEVDCYFLLKNHAVRLAIGLLALLIIMRIPFRFWKPLSLPLFIGTFALLIAVLIFGSTNNTFAKSWINLPNLPFLNSIQPAEIAKLALAFYFAHWLEKRGQELEQFKEGFLAFCYVLGIMIIPILLQPDMGSTMVLVTIAIAMYFVGGGRLRHIIAGGLIAVLISSIFVFNVPYLKNRVFGFLHLNKGCAEDVCWQAEQANIAIGSGGMFGKGLTQGVQKLYWLPQASDDFIFAASAEELGFVRIALVILAYAIIAWRGFLIAQHAPNRFSRLLATGITVGIVAQAFINIGVNISILPITGVTLPFVSYGGSSLVTALVSIGILLSISRHTTFYANPFYRRRDRWSYLSQPSRYRST